MPPRTRSPATHIPGGYHPSNDPGTFKDLLLFEERLKSNAARLKRRKRRYQFYLLLLILSTTILASDSLLETTFFFWPLNVLMRRSWDDQFYIAPHPYLLHGTLFVLGMTLFLFFASGLYSEKITYANKYVPHANRALRSFNMYLNVRTQSSNPLRLVFPFLFSNPPPNAQTVERGTGKSEAQGRNPSGPYPIIPPIPPSQNPRGELIFSSRVDKSFRERYEAYRDGYEKRRSSPSTPTSGRVLEWLGVKRRESSGGGESGTGTPVPEGARRGRLGSVGPNEGSRSRRGSPAPTVKRGSTRRKKGSTRSTTPLFEIAVGGSGPRGGTPASAELEGIAESGGERSEGDGNRTRGGSTEGFTDDRTQENGPDLLIGGGARHFNSTSFGLDGVESPT